MGGASAAGAWYSSEPMFNSRRVVTEHNTDHLKFRADVVGVTLTKSELIFAVGLYVSAMGSLLFLFEMIKPSIAALF